MVYRIKTMQSVKCKEYVLSRAAALKILGEVKIYLPDLLLCCIPLRQHAVIPINTV